MKHYYEPGSWNIICDSCGKKVKSSSVRKRWDGFIVCHSCWEPRHPQDFLRVKTDTITIPFSRPEAGDTFISVPYIVLYVEDDYVATNYFEETTL